MTYGIRNATQKLKQARCDWRRKIKRITLLLINLNSLFSAILYSLPEIRFHATLMVYIYMSSEKTLFQQKSSLLPNGPVAYKRYPRIYGNATLNHFTIN
jgi:hypothetical protein